MDSIYPIQSQHRASPQLPPPSNSSALSPSRPLSANEPQENAGSPVTALAVSSATVENDQLIIGDAGTCQFDVRTANKFICSLPLLPLLFLASTRSYTPFKVISNGLFGTLWLSAWYDTLPPNTPLPAMQFGPGARPEFANKRLVAVKKMKKRFEGG